MTTDPLSKAKEKAREAFLKEWPGAEAFGGAMGRTLDYAMPAALAAYHDALIEYANADAHQGPTDGDFHTTPSQHAASYLRSIKEEEGKK